MPEASRRGYCGNTSHGDWLVQKYGGTSVGKFLDNLVDHIVPRYLDEGYRLALVCSARSGDTKATGTTNLLLQASVQALDASNSFSVSNNRSPPETPLSNSSEALSTLTRKALHRSASQSVVPHTVNGTDHRTPSPSFPNALRSSFTMSSSVTSLQSSIDDLTAAFHTTVDKIRDDHLKAARKHISSSAALVTLEDEIEHDCERLRSFLTAAQIIDEMSPRSKDVIIGVGERLSCRIVAAVLMDRGFNSELVLLDSIVEKQDESERTDDGALSQTFYDSLANNLGERLRQCGDRIPVVTGFFGIVPGSLLQQIGRGYTDLCAALCAVGLKASELQIWKEVDGIFTADPRKVPTARLLPRITPEEAAELTYYGSEVIHPFTMEQVIRASVPIRMKNIENPKGAGTVIFPDEQTQSMERSTSSPSRFPTPVGRHATAVTIKDRILVMNVRSNRKKTSHSFFARIFSVLDRHGIVVDLIATSEVFVSLAMHGVFRKGLLDRVVADLEVLGEVSYKQDLAILSLVGKDLHQNVGIAGRMFSVLAEGHINIEIISQGSSEINVSCVISGRDAVKALNLVHLKLLFVDWKPVLTDDDSSSFCDPNVDPKRADNMSFNAAESETRACRLLALHGTPPLLLINVWDAHTAEVVASLPQTKAIASASFAIAAAAGVDDAHLTAAINLEALQRIGSIARKHGLPFTADMQHGYGEDLERHFETAIVDAGIVGCNLEDLLPDESGLLSVHEASQRIRRVRTVAIKLGVPSFVINARIDVLNQEGGSIEEVRERGTAYLQAGADFIFAWRKGPGMRRSEVAEICRALPPGKFDTQARKGGLSVEDLTELGVCRLSIGPALIHEVTSLITQKAQALAAGAAV